MLKLLAASSLVLSGALAAASSDRTLSVARSVTIAATMNSDVDPKSSTLVTVDFRGGGLGEYIEAIRKSQPTANIVVTSEAALYPVPRIELRDAELWEAIELLDTLPDQSRSQLLVSKVGRAFSISTFQSTNSDYTATGVWSLKTLLASGLTLDDIISAINTVSNIDPDKRSVRFHPETSLLVVSTPSGDLAVIEHILVTLQNAAAAQPSTALTDKLTAELNTLRVRVEALEKAQKPAGN